MSARLFVFILVVSLASVVGQQSNANPGSAGPQTASPSGSQAPNSGAANAKQGDSAQSGASQSQQQPKAGNSGQPPASGLSNDLTFPEDGPTPPAAPSSPAPKSPRLTAPRSDRVQVEDLGPGVGESSSKDAQVDLSAPPDDAKAHPQSSAAVADAEARGLSPGGISEFHTWDPHKAAKNVEVGDFYFKRKNYHAAEERYREALHYKDNDAVATIRLAVCLEKLGILDDARAEYESYLKILPHGPQAGEAQKAIQRLVGQTAK